MATIEMPEVHPLIAPLVYAVPVQLLAYHVAVAKGPTSTSRATWRKRHGRMKHIGILAHSFEGATCAFAPRAWKA